MHRHLILRALLVCATFAPRLADAQAPVRRVALIIHNAPPADSAAAFGALRAALERDSTVRVVAPRTAAEAQKKDSAPVQYFMAVSYRHDGAGERLLYVLFNVETSEIILRDSVRYTGSARSLIVPPVHLPMRPSDHR